MPARRALLLALTVTLLAGCVVPYRGSVAADARPGPCAERTFGGVPYILCEAAPEDLSLHLIDIRGRNLGSFSRLAQHLGQSPAFAMNAGMYHPDRRPVGLYVENGEIRSPLNQNSGQGNFFLEPNGVFWVDEDGAHVATTADYAALAPAPRLATQSGPMLLVEGERHPRFIEGGSSVHIRNGVGVRSDGSVVFAISRAPVNFYDFAGTFLALGATDALYLDGSVSALYAPHLGIHDRTEPLGPLIAALPKGATP